MKRHIVLHARQEKTRSVQNAPKQVSLEQSASFRINSDDGKYRARCRIVRHRRCLNPRMQRSTPSAYSHGGDCVAEHRTRERSSWRGLRTRRANKPKALSAPLTAELGGRAVQFCLTKLHLARTSRDPFWRTMNNSGACCANLKQSDSYCLVMTQSASE